MKKFKIEFLYFIALIVFTAYVALDTFVIPRSYGEAATEVVFNSPTPTPTAAALLSSGKTQDTESEAGATLTPTPTPETEIPADVDYSNEHVSIKITEYKEYDTVIYVAEVWMDSARYFETAFANDTYGKNIKNEVSDTAEDNNAVLAINGDYYGARTYGYVIRNGVLYRSKGEAGREDLVVMTDGSFMIINESDYTAQELLDMGAWQVLSFGPGLLSNGEIMVDTDTEVDQAKTSNPRTALGIAADGHYFFVVSDGRTDESEGLSLYQLATFMQSIGAVTAYNLDGGGSSTIYFNGEVINNPTTNGSSIKERKVSDIVYIAY